MRTIHFTNRPLRARRGVSVLAVVASLLTLSGIALATLAFSIGPSHADPSRPTASELDAAARDAAALAIESLWGALEAQHRGGPLTVWDARAVLDDAGLKGGDERAISLLDRAGLPKNGDHYQLGHVVVTKLDATRLDRGLRTHIVVRTEVTAPDSAPSQRDRADGGRQLEPLVSEEVFELDRLEWRGLDFALLANNLECTICHLTVDSAPRWYNRSVARAGSFGRVRVGAIEHLRMRSSAQSSFVAGALYLGDQGTLSGGRSIVDWQRLDLDAAPIDGRGRIVEDTTRIDADGAFGLAQRDLIPADMRHPDRFENLYLGYSKRRGQVDGPFPSRFPQVFPDDGGLDPHTGSPAVHGAGNRCVDDLEFATATEGVDGQLTAATAHVVARGERIADARALDRILFDSQRGELTGRVSGHVVLQGSRAEPIEIAGQLAIDGDLVISGFVKGRGSLRVRGNIWIPSDLEYLDGVDRESGGRTFGEHADGTENALGLAAGGSILIGNQFAPLWGRGNTTGDESGSFNFVLMQLSAFNRTEWIRSRAALPGADGDFRDPATYVHPNPLYAGDDFVPRYYRFDAASPIPFLVGDGWFDPATGQWNGVEHATDWTSSALAIAEPGHASAAWIESASGRYTLCDLGGTDGWIAMEQLEHLIEHHLAGRARWKPLAIDAALYSGNAVLGSASSYVLGTSGKLVVNGAIVAADLGLLAPDGLRINWDPRSSSLLGVHDDSRVAIRRLRATSIAGR